MYRLDPAEQRRQHDKGRHENIRPGAQQAATERLRARTFTGARPLKSRRGQGRCAAPEGKVGISRKKRKKSPSGVSTMRASPVLNTSR